MAAIASETRVGAACQQLRRSLAVSPQDTSTRACTALLLASLRTAVLGDSSASLADVVAHDAAWRLSPSLLYLAAAAFELHVLAALVDQRAECLQGEDPYAALVASFASSADAARADADEMLAKALVILANEQMTLSTSSVSTATTTCAAMRWAKSLACMTTVDPWAWHHLQSLPESVAEGVTAAAEAAALTAGIAAGDETARVEAAKELHYMACKRSTDPPDPWRVAAARVGMHSILKVHQAAGTLPSVVSSEKAAFVGDDRIRLLQRVSATTDVDATIAVALASAKSPSRYVADVYASLLFNTLPPLDASGAPVDDERVAVCLQHLYDHALAMLPDNDRASWVTEAYVSEGYVACVRVLVEGLDPNPHAPAGSGGSTLLHIAASDCQPACITYLRQAGFDESAHDDAGFTPLGSALTSYDAAPRALVAAIAALTDGVPDVRHMLQACGICQMPDTHSFRVVQRVTSSLARRATFRVLLHTTAAARVTPTTPVCLLAAFTVTPARAGHIIILRTEALDAYSVDGVYIPDQLRAGANVAAAIQVAVHADAAIDVLRHAWSDREARPMYVWRKHVRPHMLLRVSGTLRAWAYMRRLHALACRRTASVLWRSFDASAQ